MDIEERKSDLITRLFITPADMDYLTARWAFHNAMPAIFYWSAAQSLEKVLKAALLYGNQSTKGLGHNFAKLTKHAKQVGLHFNEKIALPDTTGLRSNQWQNSSEIEFFDYLAYYGSPNNRYGVYGANFTSADLHSLDLLYHKVRTFLKSNNFYSQDLYERNSLYSFDPMPCTKTWMIGQELLLESLYYEKFKVGQSVELKKTFSTMNFSFFDERTEEEKTFGGILFSGSPLLVHFKKARDEKNTSDNNMIDELEDWVRTNIQISSQDKKIMTKWKKKH